MTRFFIKPYSFTKYVDKDWVYWKAAKLAEARYSIWKEHEDDLKSDDDEASSYAYGGNITKIPILWDSDDYKFLSQFPPKLWTRALTWRYNTGLLQASKLRDEDPNNSIDAVPNYREELVLEYDPRKKKAGDEEEEEEDEDGSEENLDDADEKGEAGKKYVFRNVYTGFRNLLQKLEKPIKYRQEHNPPGSEKDAVGLEDIDPFETDPNSPKHHSKYTHGLHDYDITNPVEVSDEYIDSIPDDEIQLPAGQARTEKNIAAARERMKKNRQHSFAGMSVLQYPTASKSLHSWIKAQGLGLLGDAPHEAIDPHTGEPTPTTTSAPPIGDSHVGLPDATGQRIALNVPHIRRQLSYEVISPNGQKEEKSEEVNMPYLNPAVALPRIVNLSPDQRQKFAERRGFNAAEACPGSAGLTWDAIEAKCTAAKRAGAPGELYNILRNYDILTPEQKEHLMKDQRRAVHIAHTFEVETGKKKDKDFWSRPGQFYAVGFTPNKARPKIRPSDLSPEQLGVAIDKYWDKLLWEADKAISTFLKNEEKKAGYGASELPRQIINMLMNCQTDLALVCAALLARNLNNPGLGIRDEELGLIGVKKTAKPEVQSTNRKDYAYKFVKSLSQAAFGDVGSRRAREKGISGGTVSLDAKKKGAEGEGGSLLDVTPDKKLGEPGGEGGGGTGTAGANWWSRRTYNVPMTDPRDAEDAEAKGQTTYPVARVNWNVPEIGHKIDKFFQSTRNLIASKVGEKYAKFADQARDKLKLEIELTPQLFDAEMKELEARGITGPEAEEQASKAALEKLPEALRKARPDLYKDLDDKEKEAIIARNKQGVRAKLDPEMQQAEDEYMEEFFANIIKGQKWPFPEFDQEMQDFGEGPEMSLDNLKNEKGDPLDAQGVVTFIRSVWTDKGAERFAVPLLMAISKKAGKPMDEKAAQQAVMATGITPEGMDKEPQVAAPLPKKDTVPMQQPQQAAGQKPAMAATDVTGLIATLHSNPAVYEQLLSRKGELAAHKQELVAALTRLRESNKAKRQAKQQLSTDEYNAQVALGALVSTL